MKGIIFTVFERFVSDTFGDEVLEDVYDAVPEVGDAAFVSVESYPDAWILALVGAACERVDVDAPTALRTFGRYAFEHLVGRYPGFLVGHTHPKTFLMSVHGVIHVEVHKLMPDAKTPSLVCFDTGPDQLRIEYTSDRRLCPLAEGLLEGASAWFGYDVSYTHETCTHRGDAGCTWEVAFVEAAVPA